MADADAFLSNIANAVNRGEWRAPEPARELFGEFAKGWLATGMGRNGKRLSPTTAELYAHLWRKWLEPDFGAVPLHQLTPGKWRTWWATTTAKHPGSTQPAKAYRLARVILNVAVDDGLLTINPCQVKSAGEESSPERPVATEEEVERIAAAMGDAWSPLVLLAAYCSLRFGELAGLRRSSIDLLHRTVTVSEQAVELGSGEIRFKAPKSDSGRVVGIPEELVPDLERHLASEVAPAPDALVFTSPGGHPLRRTKFRSRWLAACKASGISGLHFHDLRGSGATWAGQEGATTAELMHRLGHRTTTAAMRYQHATAERDRALANRLGARRRAAMDDMSEAPKVVAIAGS